MSLPNTSGEIRVSGKGRPVPLLSWETMYARDYPFMYQENWKNGTMHDAIRILSSPCREQRRYLHR